MDSKLVGMMIDVGKFQKEILELPVTPGPLADHRFAFKTGHMHEELGEFENAWQEGHLEAQVDALVDLIYVAMGALLEMGVTPDEAFDIVHAANMRKVRGETKRGEAYDAVKPDGWMPPSHGELLATLALRAKMSPAFLEATRVREERGARYNQGTVKRADHFPFGSVGHAAICWIKMIRLRSDVEGGVNVSSAELSEHIRDLLNYLSFWFEELNGGIR